jgi:hypothetical protein
LTDLSGANLGDLQEVEGGESPGRSTPERAARWAAFYDELVTFESQILQTMEQMAERLNEDEQRVVLLTNVEPMRKLIADFSQRAERWRQVT